MRKWGHGDDISYNTGIKTPVSTLIIFSPLYIFYLSFAVCGTLASCELGFGYQDEATDVLAMKHLKLLPEHIWNWSF